MALRRSSSTSSSVHGRGASGSQSAPQLAGAACGRGRSKSPPATPAAQLASELRGFSQKLLAADCAEDADVGGGQRLPVTAASSTARLASRHAEGASRHRMSLHPEADKRKLASLESKLETQAAKIEACQQNISRTEVFAKSEAAQSTELRSQSRTDHANVRERCAELQGSMSGLIDEAQLLTQRVASVEERAFRSRAAETEASMQRSRELEQHVQQLEHQLKLVATSGEEVQRRQAAKLQRMERNDEELAQRVDGALQRILALQELQSQSQRVKSKGDEQLRASISDLTSEQQQLYTELQALSFHVAFDEQFERLKLRSPSSSPQDDNDHVQRELFGGPDPDTEQPPVSESLSADVLSSIANLRVKVDGQANRSEAVAARLENLCGPTLTALRDEMKEAWELDRRLVEAKLLQLEEEMQQARKGELDSVEEAQQRLQKEVDALKRKTNERCEVHERVDMQHERIGELQTQSRSLTGMLESLQSDLEQKLRHEIAQGCKLFEADLAAINAACSQPLKSMTVDLAEAQVSIEQLGVACAENRRIVDAKVHALGEASEVTRKQLSEEIDGWGRDLRASQDAVGAEVAQVSSELRSEVQEERQTFRTSSAEAVQECWSAIAEVRQAAERTLTELLSNQNDLQNLRQHVGDAARVSESVEDVQAELIAMRSVADSAKQHGCELSQQVGVLHEEVGSANDSITVLRQKMESMDSAGSQTESTLKARLPPVPDEVADSTEPHEEAAQDAGVGHSVARKMASVQDALTTLIETNSHDRLHFETQLHTMEASLERSFATCESNIEDLRNAVGMTSENAPKAAALEATECCRQMKCEIEAKLSDLRGQLEAVESAHSGFLNGTRGAMAECNAHADAFQTLTQRIDSQDSAFADLRGQLEHASVAHAAILSKARAAVSQTNQHAELLETMSDRAGAHEKEMRELQDVRNAVGTTSENASKAAALEATESCRQMRCEIEAELSDLRGQLEAVESTHSSFVNETRGAMAQSNAHTDALQTLTQRIDSQESAVEDLHLAWSARAKLSDLRGQLEAVESAHPGFSNENRGAMAESTAHADAFQTLMQRIDSQDSAFEDLRGQLEQASVAHSAILSDARAAVSQTNQHDEMLETMSDRAGSLEREVQELQGCRKILPLAEAAIDSLAELTQACGQDRQEVDAKIDALQKRVEAIALSEEATAMQLTKAEHNFNAVSAASGTDANSSVLAISNCVQMLGCDLADLQVSPCAVRAQLMPVVEESSGPARNNGSMMDCTPPTQRARYNGPTPLKLIAPVQQPVAKCIDGELNAAQCAADAGKTGTSLTEHLHVLQLSPPKGEWLETPCASDSREDCAMHSPDLSMPQEVGLLTQVVEPRERRCHVDANVGTDFADDRHQHIEEIRTDCEDLKRQLSRGRDDLQTVTQDLADVKRTVLSHDGELRRLQDSYRSSSTARDICSAPSPQTKGLQSLGHSQFSLEGKHTPGETASVLLAARDKLSCLHNQVAVIQGKMMQGRSGGSHSD